MCACACARACVRVCARVYVSICIYIKQSWRRTNAKQVPVLTCVHVLLLFKINVVNFKALLKYSQTDKKNIATFGSET